MLNRSKGPAVHGPRSQADRSLYKKSVQEILLNQQKIRVIEGFVDGDRGYCKSIGGKFCYHGPFIVTENDFLKRILFRGITPFNFMNRVDFMEDKLYDIRKQENVKYIQNAKPNHKCPGFGMPSRSTMTTPCQNYANTY